MKTKFYRHGTTKCRSYLQPAGNGWEVGFTLGNQKVFVGNFIHPQEATRWFQAMNTEIRTFAKRYPVGPGYATNNYRSFLSAYLYRAYYRFLDSVFTRHTSTFSKEFNKNQRRYNTYARTWYRNEKSPFLKAA